VTGDQPLGVWHVDGMPIAPLLRIVREGEGQTSAEEILRLQGRLSGLHAERVAAWMRAQGWIF
jgi:hypothetical protein